MSIHPIEPELLDAFLDGELETAESRHVQAHVDECPECRAYVEQVRDLKQALSALPRLEAPPDLVRRIKRQSPTRRRSWWLSPSFLTAASATAALVVVFAVAMYESGRNVQFAAAPSVPRETEQPGMMKRAAAPPPLASSAETGADRATPALALDDETRGKVPPAPHPEGPEMERKALAREGGIGEKEAAKAPEEPSLAAAQAFGVRPEAPPAPAVEPAPAVLRGRAVAREATHSAPPPAPAKALAKGEEPRAVTEALKAVSADLGSAMGDKDHPATEHLDVLARLVAPSPVEAALLAHRKAAELGWSITGARATRDGIMFVLTPAERTDVTEMPAAQPAERRTRGKAPAVQEGAGGAVHAAEDAAALAENAVEEEPALEVRQEAGPPEPREAAEVARQAVPVLTVIEVRIEPPGVRMEEAEDAGR